MVDLFYNFFGFNKKLFLLINNYTNFGFVPYILKAISAPFAIGNFAVYYVIAGIYFYRRLKKTQDFSQRQADFWRIYNKMVEIGIGYTIFGLIYAALKFSVNLPRPFCSLEADSFKTIYDTTMERCLSSFPSAHSGLAVLIAYYLWAYLNYWQKILAVIIICLVAIARITLAMHYPADILYGFLIVVIVSSISKVVCGLFAGLIKNIGTFINNMFVA